VTAIHKTWHSLVGFFRTDSSAKANELKDFITTYNFVAFTALLGDALSIITDLSKKFQTEVMDVSAVNVHITIALASLQGLKLDPSSGAFFGDFSQNLQPTSDGDGMSMSFKGVVLSNSSVMHVTRFGELCKTYIDSLVDNLEERLCNHSTAVLDAFCVLA